MLKKGISYTETLRIKGFQLVLSLYGDPDEVFECCLSATISNAERPDPENKDSIVPQGFRQVSMQTVKSLEKALRN